jgi:hypothetical protein
MAAKTARNPTSRKYLLCCLVGVGESVFEGSLVWSGVSVFCALESKRSGEPQRGQDLFFQFLRLEPHEVQYMSYNQIPREDEL